VGLAKFGVSKGAVRDKTLVKSRFYRVLRFVQPCDINCDTQRRKGARIFRTARIHRELVQLPEEVSYTGYTGYIRPANRCSHGRCPARRSPGRLRDPGSTITSAGA
jgi:hypothetical protein